MNEFPLSNDNVELAKFDKKRNRKKINDENITKSC